MSYFDNFVVVSLKVYGRGTGADCRNHVQRLNTMRGEMAELKELVPQETAQEEENSGLHVGPSLKKSLFVVKLKIPPTQNILWPFQRNIFFILILAIFSLFLMSFKEISKKFKYLPTYLENYE